MGGNYIRSRNISNCVRELAEDFGMLLEDDTKGWASDSEREAAALACSKDPRWAHLDWKKYVVEAKSRYPRSVEVIRERVNADIAEAEEWERGFDGIWASIAHFFGN